MSRLIFLLATVAVLLVYFLLLGTGPVSITQSTLGQGRSLLFLTRFMSSKSFNASSSYLHGVVQPHNPTQPTPRVYSFGLKESTFMQPKFCPLVEKWVRPSLTKEDTLLQVEIPKTGTTSFQILLRSTCHQTTLQPKPLGRCKSARCCHPKLRCNWFHPALVEAEMCAVNLGLNASRFYPITIFRNPIVRTVSEYREWKKNWPRSPNYAPDLDLLRKDISLYDFIHHPHNPANNRQLWMITPVAHGKLRKSKDYSAFYTFWKNYYKDENFVSRLNNDKDLLELTKAYLVNDFAFFGLTEFYNLSIKLFLYTFNAAGHLNHGRYLNKSSVNVTSFIGGNATILNAVMEKNKADVELYEFAVNLFKERVNQMQSCLGEPPIVF